MRSARHRPDLRADEGGAAILEFALVLPILLALVAGSFEIGRALWVRAAMLEAVRGGARYLARVPDPGCRPVCSEGVARARAMTADAIVRTAGLARDAFSVETRSEEAARTVTVEAGTRLAPLVFGLAPSLAIPVSAVHREWRVGE